MVVALLCCHYAKGRTMYREKNNTLGACTDLLRTFSGRGVAPDEVPRLFGDLFKLFVKGGTFTADMMNHELKGLGWPGTLMDRDSMAVVFTILEREFDFTVNKHAIH